MNSQTYSILTDKYWFTELKKLKYGYLFQTPLAIDHTVPEEEVAEKSGAEERPQDNEEGSGQLSHTLKSTSEMQTFVLSTNGHI